MAGGIVDGIEVQLGDAFAARRARRVLHGGGGRAVALSPMRNVRRNVWRVCVLGCKCVVCMCGLHGGCGSSVWKRGSSTGRGLT